MVLLFPLLATVYVISIPTDSINQIVPEEHAHFYKYLLIIIKGNYFNVFYKILLTFFIVFNSFTFNKLILYTKIYKPNNWFPGFIYLMLVGLCSNITDALYLLISNSFLLLAIMEIIKTLRKQDAIFDYFNAGMLVSFAFLFWVNIIYFLPIIFIGLFILRSQQIREWVSAILGFFLPFFIFLSIWFFVYSNFNILFDFHYLIISKEEIPSTKLIHLLTLSFIGIFSLISTFIIISKFKKTEKDIQDYYKIFFLLFILSVAIVVIIPNSIVNILIIAITSISIPFSLFFLSIKKKIISELLFNLFLLLNVAFLYGISF